MDATRRQSWRAKRSSGQSCDAWGRQQTASVSASVCQCADIWVYGHLEKTGESGHWQNNLMSRNLMSCGYGAGFTWTRWREKPIIRASQQSSTNKLSTRTSIWHENFYSDSMCIVRSTQFLLFNCSLWTPAWGCWAGKAFSRGYANGSIDIVHRQHR